MVARFAEQFTKKCQEPGCGPFKPWVAYSEEIVDVASTTALASINMTCLIKVPCSDIAHGTTGAAKLLGSPRLSPEEEKDDAEL